jgi:hypothetical protein
MTTSIDFSPRPCAGEGCGGEIVVLREISDVAPEHGEGMLGALQMLNGRSPGWGRPTYDGVSTWARCGKQWQSNMIV